MPNGDIDRATWNRLGSDSKGCNLPGCTHEPEITVRIQARTIGDGSSSRGAETLADRTYRYCAAHAEQKFIRATEAITK